MTERNNDGGSGDSGNYGGYGMGSGGYGSGGYGGGGAVGPSGGGNAQPRPFGGLETETVTDPNENAFQVQLPKGWRNQAVLLRTQDSYRSIVSAQSQDGATTLFIGDPHLPNFIEPTPMMNAHSPGVEYMVPQPRFQTYIPAEPFFLHDLQMRYQQAPGFRITGAAPNPEIEQAARADAQKHGMNAHITATLIAFEFTPPGGKTVRGLLNGATINLGGYWFADVSGVTTTSGDPAPWNDILGQIKRSQQTNPQWRQQEQARHNQRMEAGRMQNQNIQDQTRLNTQLHQTRMNDIQRTGDANTQRWQSQQTQNDIGHNAFMNTINAPTGGGFNAGGGGESYQDTSHERFMNYIKDEETVLDQSGNSYQVETGHDRYFVNTNDNTYVGTDITVDQNDLGSQMGVNNPNDFQEVQIKE